MIIRGRSIYTNGATAGKLTRYLLDNPKNERAVFLGAHGTAFPNDLEKSIDQMIWRAEDSRSDKALYFCALSPDLKVDKELTEAEWEEIRYIQAKALGLEGQPYALVQHEKYGENGELRIHRHVIYQKYDTEEQRMISDEYDRRRNAQARAEIEEKLGHDRTFQRWTIEEMEQQAEMKAEQERQEAEAERQRQTDEDQKAEAERQAEIEREERQKRVMAEMLDNGEEIEEENDRIAYYRKLRQQMIDRGDEHIYGLSR